MKNSTKNDIKDLNAKEQYILRHLLKTGNFNTTLRLDWKLLNDWYERFDEALELEGKNTYKRIETVIKNMIKKRIIQVETIYLDPTVSPTQRKLYCKFYALKPYWKSQNSYELKQFSYRSFGRQEAYNFSLDRRDSREKFLQNLIN